MTKPIRVAYSTTLDDAGNRKLKYNPLVHEAINKLINQRYGKKSLKKLKGYENGYRLRIGEWRFVFKFVTVAGELAIMPIKYIKHNYNCLNNMRDLLDKKEKVDFNALLQKAIIQTPDTTNNKHYSVTYHNKQYIELTDIQEQALPPMSFTPMRDNAHIVHDIRGSGGAGKTAIAKTFLHNQALAAHVLEEKTQHAYLTSSQALVNDIAEDFKEDTIKELNNIHALSFLELLETWGLLKGKVIVDRYDFKTFYVALQEHKRFKGWHLDWEDSYEECMLCHGRSKEEYLSLGEDESLIAKAKRADLYDYIYTPYIKGLDRTNHFNPAFCPDCPDKYIGYFKSLVIDEAQDFSFSQYKFFKAISKGGQILFCSDHNQNLNSSLFSHDDHLNHLFYDEKLEEKHQAKFLPDSHRASIATMELANVIANKKFQAVGGYNKADGVKQMNPSANSLQGGIYGLDDEKGVEDLLARNLGADFVIVSHPSEVQRLKAKYPKYDAQILTPEEIKGRGRAIVLWYKIATDEFLDDALEKHKTLDLTREIQHKPKRGIGEYRWNKEYNRMYVTATRAKNLMFIYEPRCKDLDTILDGKLSQLVTAGPAPEEAFQGLDLSLDAWIKLAESYYKDGKQETARHILKEIVKQNEKELSAFDERLRPVKLLPAPIVKQPIEVVGKQAEAESREQNNQASSKVQGKTPKASTALVSASKATIALRTQNELALSLSKNFQKSQLLHIVEMHSEDKSFLKDFLFNQTINSPSGKISLWQHIHQDQQRMQAFCQWLSEESLLVGKLPIAQIQSRLASPEHQNLFKILVFLNDRLTAQPVGVLHHLPPAYFAVQCFKEIKPEFRILEILNQYSPIRNQTNHAGQPILHYSISQACDISPKLIATFKCNPNQLNAEGMAAIHMAAAANNRYIFGSFCVSLDVKEKNYAHEVTGWQAAHYAASRDRHENLRVISNRKDMSIDQATTHGETPLFIAICYGHTRSIQMLLELGVSPNKPWLISTKVFVKILETHSDYLAANPRGHKNIIQLVNYQPQQRVEIRITPCELAVLFERNEIERLLKKPPNISQVESFPAANAKNRQEMVVTALQMLYETYHSAMKESKGEEGNEVLTVLSETFSKMIEGHLEDESFLQELFLLPAIQQEGKNISLIAFICANEGRMNAFFTCVLNKTKFLMALPIKEMNAGRPKTDKVWEKKWAKLEALQIAFLPAYQKALAKAKSSDIDEINNFPAVFAGIHSFNDLASNVNILRLFHACGDKMDQINQGFSLLDIIHRISGLWKMIPLLIKEETLNPLLPSARGLSIVWLAMDSMDDKLIEQLGKILPKEQFNQVNSENQTPLQVAIEAANTSMLSKLVPILCQDKDLLRSNLTKTFTFAANGELEDIKRLYAEGEDVHRHCVCILADLGEDASNRLREVVPPIFYPTQETAFITPAQIAYAKGYHKIYSFFENIRVQIVLGITEQFEKQSFLKLIPPGGVQLSISKAAFLKGVLKEDTIPQKNGLKISLLTFISMKKARQNLFFQWIAEESALLAELPSEIDHPSFNNHPKFIALSKLQDNFAKWYRYYFKELTKRRLSQQSPVYLIGWTLIEHHNIKSLPHDLAREMLHLLKQGGDTHFGPNSDLIHHAIMTNNQLFLHILITEFNIPLSHSLKMSEAMLLEKLSEEEKTSLSAKIRDFYQQRTAEQDASGHILITGQELVGLLQREHILELVRDNAKTNNAGKHSQVQEALGGAKIAQKSQQANQVASSQENAETKSAFSKAEVDAMIARREKEGLNQPRKQPEVSGPAQLAVVSNRPC